jgi:predicted dinucleotide-binding enzyme
VLEAHGARAAPSGEGRAGDALALRFGSAAADVSPGEASPSRPHA